MHTDQIVPYKEYIYVGSYPVSYPDLEKNEQPLICFCIHIILCWLFSSKKHI